MRPASFSSVRSNPWVITGIVFAATVLWIYFFKHSPLAGEYLAEWSVPARKLVFFSLLTLIPLLAMFVLHRPKEIFRSWGFSGNFILALSVSALCVLLMFVGNAFVMPITAGFSDVLSKIGLSAPSPYINTYWVGEYWKGVLSMAVVAGFFEEVMFRGFIFGQLFRFARWGFVPAVLASVVPFAFLHIQFEWKLMAIGSMFILTALDGAFLCWMFVQWRNNLWVPIWLHILINLSWIAFEGNNPEGRVWANIVRLTAIVLSILFTVWVKKNNGESIRIERGINTTLGEE